MLNIRKLREKKKKLSSFLKYESNYHIQYLLNRSKTGRPSSVIVASAHKVGSTWLHNILRDLYIYRCNRVPETYRTSPRNPWVLSLKKQLTYDFLIRQTRSHLYKSHSLPPSWDVNQSINFISIFRDPRDMTISNIFYLANLDPKLGGWKKLAGMDIKSRIIYYLDNATYDLDLISDWWNYPHAFKTYYEALLTDPFYEIRRIADYVEAPVKDNDIIRAVNNNSFTKLSVGRPEGNEDSRSFYRKGISGDWLNHFDNELVDYFKNAQSGRWNNLLLDLKYEESPDWKLQTS